ncbi:MAG TPA: LacI family DNA-binding transcriptional regulator, partial [Verrucomicrobiae bacterium]
MAERLQITLKDVAHAAGVSAMTVSMALRDDPRIRPARRKLIQELAQRMGYSPNAMAVAMVQQRRKVSPHPIAAELAWLNHWQEPARLRRYKEFDLYWRGAVAAAAEKGFRLEEFVVREGFTYRRLETVLLARNIQGILIPPHGGAAVTHPQISSMDWSRFSVVRFGYSIPDFPAYVVAGNYTQALMLAFSEMWKLGYRRIGFVCHRNPGTRGKAGFLLAQTEVELKYRVP